MSVKRYLNDLASLFFPQTCVGCDQLLVYGEYLICTDCWHRLPYTQSHLDESNPSVRQLWGRVQVEAVASYWHFRDASRVKQIIHHFKYKRRPEIGVLIGIRYGKILIETDPFRQAEVIVPVPLHPRRLRERGYNQSGFFAEGLSRSMERPVQEQCLVRQQATSSQTHKKRYERYENMLGTFVVTNGESISGRHVLLVDDVLTTGATLEACATALLAGGAAKVSAVTIAKAL